MPTKIRVLVLGDDPAVRMSVRLLLQNIPDLRLVGETANLLDLRALWAKAKSHVLLIEGGNLTLFREIFLLAPAGVPPVRLMALIQSTAVPPLAELLQIPIHGCCLKAEINENLIHILRAVAGGNTSVSHGVLESQPVRSIHEVLDISNRCLTEKEEQIVVLIAQGLSNGEIASALGLAYQTVSNYLKVIYSKLGTNQRAEVMRRFHGAVFMPWGGNSIQILGNRYRLSIQESMGGPIS